MPSLAISDTPLSRRLFLEGSLEVDYFETSGPLTEGAVETLAATQTLFLLHNGVWNWSLGDAKALSNLEVLSETRKRLVLTKAPWLSVHLGYSTARVDFKKGSGFIPILPNYPSKSQPLTRAALFSALTKNIRLLQESISVPLLIENLEYNPTGAYEHITEAQFIAEVLNVTDVGLLLDLAHAQVSVSRFGQDIKSYLATLPLERVRQLHISGPRSAGETLFDAHEPLREEDYALLADILPKTNALVLTLEYGKDEQALLEQVSKLRKILEAQ